MKSGRKTTVKLELMMENLSQTIEVAKFTNKQSYQPEEGDLHQQKHQKSKIKHAKKPQKQNYKLFSRYHWVPLNFLHPIHSFPPPLGSRRGWMVRCQAAYIISKCTAINFLGGGLSTELGDAMKLGCRSQGRAASWGLFPSRDVKPI